MVFESIKLQNFRQFKNTTLSFSTDKEKNVTVVVGEITSGKSTLIKAFLWCLYRENLFEKSKSSLINHDELENMMPFKPKDVKVEIELSHNDFRYKITTIETYIVDNKGKLSIRESASTKLMKTGVDGASKLFRDELADMEINQILRKDLYPYFFFDGETSTIENLVDKDNVEQAISDLMGMKAIEILKKISNPTYGRGAYQSLMQKLASNNNQLINDKRTELDIIQVEKELIEGQIEKNDHELSELNKQKKDIISIIENNKDVEAEVEEKQKLQKKYKSILESLDFEYREIINSIHNPSKVFNLLFYQIDALFHISHKVNQSKLTSDLALSDINGNAISQLIERGYCLCGEKIVSGDSHHKHLIDQLNYIAPKNYSRAIKDFVDEASEDTNKALNFKERFDREIKEVKEKFASLEYIFSSIQEIDQRIVNKPNVLVYKDKLTEIQNQINNFEEINLVKKGRLEEKDEQVRKINEEIRKLTVNVSGNAIIEKRMAYVNSIHEKSEAYINKHINEILSLLNNNVSKAFSSVFKGERTIQISKEFKVTTYVNGKADLQPSSGTKVLTTISFVSGLIKTAKEFTNQKNQLAQKEDSKLPLVMDAPFSKIGEQPIKDVSMHIPNLCDQIIIFVLEKDYKVAKTEMRNKVGYEYKLFQHSATFSDVKVINND